MPSQFQRRLIATCIALALGVAVVPAQCAAAKTASVQVKPNAAFTTWSDAFAADWVRLSPERATSAQYFSGAEQQALDRQMAPNTPAQREKYQAMAKAGLAKLNRFLAGPLDSTQRISAETMRWSLQQASPASRSRITVSCLRKWAAPISAWSTS